MSKDYDAMRNAWPKRRAYLDALMESWRARNRERYNEIGRNSRYKCNGKPVPHLEMELK